MAARGLVNGRGPRSGRDLVFLCYPPELLFTPPKKTEADTFGSASLSLRADGGNRTHDPEITNHVLWPTELHRQNCCSFFKGVANVRLFVKLPILCFANFHIFEI